MNPSRRSCLRVLSGALAGALLPLRAAETDFDRWSDAQKEEFLTRSKIVSAAEIGHGVTKPVKLELSLGTIQHSAKIQTIDKQLPPFFPPKGQPIPMRDSWKYNVAAYHIDRLLGLNMVTVEVPRTYLQKPAAFSWWVDGVQFEEVDLIKRDVKIPDPESYHRQKALAQTFDELIINIDRNLSNTLITTSWKLALIDHSRSFAAYHGIRNQENLTRCSRGLLAKMRGLAADSLSHAAGPLLTPAEKDAVLARRDLIVAFFENAAKTKGEENVLFS